MPCLVRVFFLYHKFSTLLSSSGGSLFFSPHIARALAKTFHLHPGQTLLYYRALRRSRYFLPCLPGPFRGCALPASSISACDLNRLQYPTEILRSPLSFPFKTRNLGPKIDSPAARLLRGASPRLLPAACSESTAPRNKKNSSVRKGSPRSTCATMPCLRTSKSSRFMSSRNGSRRTRKSSSQTAPRNLMLLRVTGQSWLPQEFKALRNNEH